VVLLTPWTLSDVTSKRSVVTTLTGCWPASKTTLFTTSTKVRDVPEGASFAEFCRHMANCYREDLEDVVIMATSDGTRASAEFCVSGICRATDGGLPPARGQVYRLPAGTFFAVRNGRICRVSTDYNLADWLTQVRDGESR
jgi:steroid delta-isomerase-like uncharacterized protein